MSNQTDSELEQVERVIEQYVTAANVGDVDAFLAVLADDVIPYITVVNFYPQASSIVSCFQIRPSWMRAFYQAPSRRFLSCLVDVSRL
ncbi:MAG: hypothetical protein AB1345_13670 [Chloroflexota bacterium]